MLDKHAQGRRFVAGATLAALALGAVAAAKLALARPDERPPMVAVDLDRDGRTELVVAGDDGRSVELYRRTAAGLALYHSYAVTGRLDAMLVADVDGDRIGDLVLIDGAAGDVVMLEGDGQGAFRALRRRPVPGAPSAVSVFDVDQDGRRDLLVSHAGAPTLSLLRAGAGGEFGTVESIELPGVPRSIAQLDADGDGHVDTVLELDEQGIAVLLSRPRPAMRTGPAVHLR